MPRIAEVPEPLSAEPLNPIHVLLLFGMTYGACAVASRFLADSIGFGEDMHRRELVNAVLWTLVMSGLVVALRPLRSSVRTWFRAPIQPLRFGDIAIATLLIVTFSLGVHRILVVMPTIHSDPTYYDFWRIGAAFAPTTAASLLALALNAWLLAPFHEEALFRGILLNVFRPAIPFTLAIVISSLMFGLMHGRTALSASFAGFVIALVYLRYGTLWPAILVHSLANVLVWPKSIASFTLLKTREQAQSYEGWFFEFLLAALFIPLALAFWRRFRPT